MALLTFLACFFATAISMVELTRISIRHHDTSAPSSLSELAAAEDRLLGRFRKILFVCSTLFAVTVYGFIVPRLTDSLPAAIAWTVIYSGILIAAVIPARNKTLLPHLIAAEVFATGMLALAYIFWKDLQGTYALLEFAILIVMAIAAILTFADKKRFIIYELVFIYFNHISIVIAALALR